VNARARQLRDKRVAECKARLLLHARAKIDLPREHRVMRPGWATLNYDCYGFAPSEVREAFDRLVADGVLGPEHTAPNGDTWHTVAPLVLAPRW
jgi:hypothetical protein